MNAEIIGHIAGTLTTICFVPQAVKIIRDKHTEGVSLWTYVLFSLGVAAWLAYGIAIKTLPVILFNAMTLLLSVLILFHLVKYRKKAP